MNCKIQIILILSVYIISFDAHCLKNAKRKTTRCFDILLCEPEQYTLLYIFTVKCKSTYLNEIAKTDTVPGGTLWE